MLNEIKEARNNYSKIIHETCLSIIKRNDIQGALELIDYLEPFKSDQEDVITYLAYYGPFSYSVCSGFTLNEGKSENFRFSPQEAKLVSVFYEE